MSDRSGLGVVEVALLSACADLGRRGGAPRLRCERVLAELEQTHGVHPREGYRVLCDLASGEAVMVPLFDGAGNFGSFGMPAAAPRYTEARLSPAGEAALAAERGLVGAVPVGLVNGTMWAGGVRPSLHPGRVRSALLAADEARDEELLGLVGPPVFPTRCAVDGDLDALAAGERVDLRLSPRVEMRDGRVLRITNFPPGVDAAIATHAFFDDLPVIAERRGLRVSVSAATHPGPPCFDLTYGTTDAVEAVLEAVARLTMLTRIEPAHLGASVPAMLRTWLDVHGNDHLVDRLEWMTLQL